MSLVGIIVWGILVFMGNVAVRREFVSPGAFAD
jgi:hypothetical protein